MKPVSIAALAFAASRKLQLPDRPACPASDYLNRIVGFYANKTMGEKLYSLGLNCYLRGGTPVYLLTPDRIG
jgi:hypothetical protein